MMNRSNKPLDMNELLRLDAIYKRGVKLALANAEDRTSPIGSPMKAPSFHRSVPYRPLFRPFGGTK